MSRLRVTILDISLLIACFACGFWLVRATGVLYWQAPSSPIHQLLILDYFTWGASLPGPALIAISYYCRRTSLLPGEKYLLMLSATNLLILGSSTIGAWWLYSTLMFLRYHLGCFVLAFATAVLIGSSRRIRTYVWTNTLGICILIAQTLGLIGFRLTPINVVLEAPG